MSIAKLVEWLGPWAGTRLPRDVVRTSVELPRTGDALPLRAYVYRPARGRAIGAYLLSPGLHYLGPEDPRSDRFARVLGAAGFIVVAPFLPDYLDLQLAPRATDDLAVAWESVEAEARSQRLPRPAIFSISFGSQPAIALAARDTHRARVGALVLFGGFADFDATVKFAITGKHDARDAAPAAAYDPLNVPVVFLNLLPYMPIEGDREALARAWRAFVQRTWGKPEMKSRSEHAPVAEDIAQYLYSEADREMFRVGCGLRPGAIAHVERALSQGETRDAFAFADPRPDLARVLAPVVVVHGQEDDVIPWIEAEKIRASLPAGHPHRVYLTGMYGHSGTSKLANVRAIAREGRTLLAIVRAMVAAPCGELR